MLQGILKNEEGGVKELWALTYPLVLSTASATIMQVVNRIFLAWYSPEALAAVMPAGILSFTFICFFLGTASYTNVFVAQYYGGKRYANLSVSLWQGVWLAVFSSVLIALCIVPGLMIISMSAHTPAVKEMERQYFVITTAAGGMVPLGAALSAFFTGRGKTKVTMIVQVLANAFNILLSYLLIFGKWGFPELGIRGGAIALVAGSFVPVILFLAIILNEKHRRIYRTARLFSFHWPLFAKLLKYGVPNGVGFFLDIASFTVFVFLAGNMGDAVLAANNVIFTINTLAFMPILGVGMAVETLVGQYMGANRPLIAARVAYSGLKLAGMYFLPLAAAFLLLPEPLLHLFSAHSAADMSEIFVIARVILKVLVVFTAFDMIGIIFSNAIRGGGDTKFQMLTSGLCAWFLFVPGVYVLVNRAAPITALWWWGTFYSFMLGAVFYARCRSGRWQSLRLGAHR
ncbi:MAG: MATE family efflux transporter [Elusimicrobiaceae bacterium]|nr:MATE family efflux transporter [Elusimicrobiaceae bacterium]